MKIDLELIRSFAFNRIVLGLLIGACFIITALDLFLDRSQSNVVEFAALKIATVGHELIAKLAPQGVSPQLADSLNQEFQKENPSLHLIIFSKDSLKDEFQKDAYTALVKDPSNPYCIFEDSDKSSMLRCAVFLSGGFYELDIALKDLTAFAEEELNSFLWLLILFALGAFCLLAIFLGYFRHSSIKLLETQNQALEQQKTLTSSYSRFFPQEFLKLLNKSSVLDIHLGDQIEKPMAILFSDIRHFTTLIEQATPAESFQILNEYLGKLGPIIRAHNGWIDKYVGDATMALFDQAEEALIAILEIMQVLNAMPSSAKRVNEIGSGLHFGHTIAGTVGEPERMDGTVISDVANTAARIESLNKAYGTHILISQQFLEQIADTTRYKIRFIDYVYVLGRKASVRLYEVFNNDSPELIQKKEQVQEDWKKAVECYQTKQFEQALPLLQKIHTILPEDIPIATLLARTEKYIATPPPADWTPIERLSHKDEL